MILKLFFLFLSLSLSAAVLDYETRDCESERENKTIDHNNNHSGVDGSLFILILSNRNNIILRFVILLAQLIYFLMWPLR